MQPTIGRVGHSRSPSRKVLPSRCSNTRTVHRFSSGQRKSSPIFVRSGPQLV